MNNELNEVLENLYVFLRENGFSDRSIVISNLIHYVQTKEIVKFKKEFNSKLLWGAAGSIRDIELRNTEQQNELDNYLNELKKLGSKL